MAGGKTDEENNVAPYTFIWNIQNYTRPPHLNIQSPSFIVDSIEKTKWCLVLHVNQHCALCYIKRLADNSILKSKELNFELTVLCAKGLPFKEQRGAYFHLNHQSKIVKLIDNSVFEQRRAEILPNNTLSIRCQIWRKERDVLTTDFCFARTQLRLEQRSFLWPVKKFMWLRLGQIRTYHLQTNPAREPRMTFNLYLDEDDARLHLDIFARGEMFYSIGGEIAIVDVEGKAIVWVEVGFQSNLKERNISIPLRLTKRQLMDNEDHYVPNGVLLLRCFFNIFAGIDSSRIEYCSQASSEKEENLAKPEDMYDLDEIPAFCSDSCNLKKDLGKLYVDGAYSDITLRAGKELFQVHKNILSIRSPMFKAMFTSEMMEKNRSTIDLPDLDEVTLRRLLFYIYTDTLEDLSWEESFNLFRAADVYGLGDLKKRCSDNMKANINKANVCDILYVADMHHDEALILAAKDFIFEEKQLFDTKEWKLFKNNNELLASEVLEYVALIIGND